MMKRWLGVMAVAALFGCTTTQETAMDSQVAAMSNCEKIEALVQGHRHGFPQLKTTLSNAKIMQVWKARYHLVGDACQVWGWSADKFSYVCSQTEPNQETAMDHYGKAKAVTRQCLGPEWVLTEGKRDMGDGVKAEFAKAGESAVITVVAASSPTVFHNEWKTYYFVGDPNDIK
ncbi:MAG: hypothetical protein VYA55_06130 [Pseudomonadota bacterium]|nr:hypothetical protein [Pseudomonadota bacterium]